MPLKLSELANKKRRLELEFLDEKFWVDYNPAAQKLKETQVAIEKAKEDNTEKAILMLCEQVEQLVIAWDVVGADGERLGVTQAAIIAADIPFQFLVFVLNSINADMRALGEVKAVTSQGGSFSKGR